MMELDNHVGSLLKKLDDLKGTHRLVRSRRHQKSQQSRKRSAPEPVATGVKTHDAASRLLSRTSVLIAIVIVAVIVFAGGMSWHFLTGGLSNVQSSGPPGEPTALATYVGSETCAGCHQAQAQLWRPSQHKLAMQHATDKSVLGNFDDASSDHYGVHSRFFRRNNKFLVETDGVDGKLAVFEVKYTFGLDPLQHVVLATGHRLRQQLVDEETRQPVAPEHKGRL
jgi:hypothetical protein